MTATDDRPVTHRSHYKADASVDDVTFEEIAWQMSFGKTLEQACRDLQLSLPTVQKAAERARRAGRRCAL